MSTVLPFEIAKKPFYVHKFYVPTYYYCYKFIKDWIATNCLREDTSRVVMASNDYAFRRRFETTDMSKNYNDLEVSSLNFPFANFWPQNSSITPDERFAAKTAALFYVGTEMGSTRVRAASVVMSVPTTIYFDREDDARMCSENLYFDSYNEHYYSTHAFYANNYFDLPISLEIKNITFNPQFKENDWLKQQRIYPVTFNMDVRTFILYPPRQPRYDVDIEGDNFYDSYDPGFEQNVITRKVVLDFYGYEDILYNTVVVGDGVYEGAVLLDRLECVKTTKTSGKVEWEYNEDSGSVSEIRITNMQEDSEIITLDADCTSYTFGGLIPNSTYSYLFEFINSEGNVGFRKNISIKTANTTVKRNKSSLVGLTSTKKDN